MNNISLKVLFSTNKWVIYKLGLEGKGRIDLCANVATNLYKFIALKYMHRVKMSIDWQWY
jgi:hypothetical protein